MLNAFIIEELKRREQERRDKERQRPLVDLPRWEEKPDPRSESRPDKKKSSVVHIDIINPS